jgi:putative ATP-dependent endonuclease of the OLD family
LKVSRLIINNFRGVKHASLLFPDHAVLIGDNNVGKTTVLEAIDLVLGPDRLSHRPPVDEHDFYLGQYLLPEQAEAPEPAAAPPQITVEATITGLSPEQLAHFSAHIEWWDSEENKLYDDSEPEGVDAAKIVPALRVTFIGKYDPEEDDFEGSSYYARSLEDGGPPDFFSKRDKQRCGFVYLRSLRTGSRALSLEHGSLLDIILRLKEIRPQMWEQTISNVSAFNVASDEELGISGILNSISDSLKKYVPREWGVNPHLKVSALTREHLRKVVTAFIATGDSAHAAPFFRQGTGTINMLVLAMLSQIAEDKQNVIFAMEEPETAIPPYAQKRIVHEVCKLSAQSLFTSHSPYVLEEFNLGQTVILSRTPDGVLTSAFIKLPDSVKHKRYRREFRTRFCEGLLARRVLIAEGATEGTSFLVAARRLEELDSKKYRSLEGLGVCVIDAGTDSQLADLGKLYRGLGKKVYAVCDKQTDNSKTAIEAEVDKLFMHEEQDFEDLVIKNTSKEALQRFCKALKWPSHLAKQFPDPVTNASVALKAYFDWSKGNWGIADFLAQCTEAEIPEWIKKTCEDLCALCASVDTASEAKQDANNPSEGSPHAAAKPVSASPVPAE